MTTIIVDTITLEFLNMYPSDITNPPQVVSQNPIILLDTLDDPLILCANRSNDESIILQLDPTKVAAKTAQAWVDLRAQRKLLLAESDWTQLQNNPLSAQKITEWATYRQALRDLPDNTTDPTAPIWPIPPS